jgi:hypothetical protein
VDKGSIWGDEPLTRSPSMEKVTRMPEVYLIGMEDKEPSSIMNAIGNGHRVAKVI